jgi:hypothetical protein
MIDWRACPSVERNPELVSGAWVFRGTRVPVVDLVHARSVLQHIAKTTTAVNQPCKQNTTGQKQLNKSHGNNLFVDDLCALLFCNAQIVCGLQSKPPLGLAAKVAF